MSVPPLLLISGPCVIETEELTLRIAAELKRLAAEAGLKLVFKASFDKANRSGAGAQRGAGLVEGLRILKKVKDDLGLPVTTDVHEREQMEPAARVVDILQIPAFLCRQTDLLVAAAEAAARHGRSVNVKKGQFLAPEDTDNIAEKLIAAGCNDYWLTERGTTFGYRNLVVDMRGLAKMKAAGHRVIFDATHSVQQPGGLGKATGGDGAMAPVLARAAVAVGIDGLFIETHPDPKSSPSDGPNMIPLAEMGPLLRKLVRIHEAAHV
ncbi:2-dehydro-3-deoxyphosphooctonate aldolase (KDO 8-P synthase) [Verrucomicrobium sp. GAS474]|uniref:3-deoxy-8-phosphooctulonate synthase n=1 Tax=Verrucomicrobium sp. GAS474 TaxID=1882831 RepID=UPI00087B6BE2|nr:3-deoxy-8-phosphooctulonate synthase [Verrucomicrobium sp. GAS474]SDU08931.1 2-dehydro-3-deoxyphosphooctonate aldolase (KDO 8-P synthase) [Verrucomicrobium sp. GAS474]